ncbi:acetyl-CoA carboxylase biotin carboxyl carrier protein subunit [Metabacillus bambusae]|uniref:Acetyl-CoA carboxylase biotin carboxyl carrier protein subunit n=1 Tax=Metabacillus bambusae TaxID=2795218 RepID=A0ABS3N8E3_9BACI|nr:acetyl-CoA carboxylase biotin carboxyl carrier protein subunit [Metabacillus bambusae]MBO1514315.1 acetyl-CoA carboxylase biotin carboxyl carrier protein subunit [Metabacillus bambusae]
MKTIVTNMTGSVWRILVQAGDQVEKDQDVVILESMKMEIPIVADASGKVKEIKINEGDFVSDGDVLMELE